MQNDIQAALGLLAQAAKGRAFMWDNPLCQRRRHGYYPITRLQITAETTIDGREEYDVRAFAAGGSNVELAHGAQTLADVVNGACLSLQALPLDADDLSKSGAGA